MTGPDATGTPGSGDRARVLAIAQRLARPFALAAETDQPLAAILPFEAAPDTRANRRAYNAVEGIVRLLSGLAPMLELRWRRLGRDDWQLVQIQKLLVRTVRSEMHLFQSGVAGEQALVEAGFLAQALLRAPNALWSSLSAEDRATLQMALEGTRTITPHHSNWILFPAMVETALIQLAGTGRPGPTLEALDAFERWYLGDGLYGDGPLNAADYYGGYVIHPMLDQMAAILSDRIPEWGEARPRIRARFDRYCEVLERMIAPDGSFPPLGRSLSYRAAAFQPLAMAALRPKGHPALGWGQLRSALLAVIFRTMEGAGHYDSQGWLTIGLGGHQPALAETYISTGSLYLCTQALLVLGLPPKHPFWSAPPRPITQAILWGQGTGTPADDLAADITADIALERRPRPGRPRK